MGSQSLVQRIEPQGMAHGIGRRPRQQRIQRATRSFWSLRAPTDQTNANQTSQGSIA